MIGVWPTADFHEREAFDMMGIGIDGHPNLKRILLDDDWDGHPLRKDYPARRRARALLGGRLMAAATERRAATRSTGSRGSRSRSRAS